jgi:hypothetical protein
LIVSKQPVTPEHMRAFIRNGTGCPACGPDADVEGKGVEIAGEFAYQSVSCSRCDAYWRAKYKFESIDSESFLVLKPTIALPFGIYLFQHENTWLISSSLRAEYAGGDCADEFDDRMTTLETFILNSVKAGVDVATQEFQRAVKATVEAYKFNS